MKIEVLTPETVTIRPWRWWTSWIDVSVYDYGGVGYLLQMKVNRNNSKKFRSTPFKSRVGIAHPSYNEVGDLMPIDHVKDESS